MLTSSYMTNLPGENEPGTHQDTFDDCAPEGLIPKRMYGDLPGDGTLGWVACNSILTGGAPLLGDLEVDPEYAEQLRVEFERRMAIWRCTDPKDRLNLDLWGADVPPLVEPNPSSEP